MRRALAAPPRAYALLAEPVDPAVEAERLIFRRAYADVFAAALRDGVAAGELRRWTSTSSPPPSSARSGRRSSARSRNPDAAPDVLVASLQAFCLSAIQIRSPHVRHA